MKAKKIDEKVDTGGDISKYLNVSKVSGKLTASSQGILDMS